MKPHFNNGFVTAIALFLEHKNLTEHIIKIDGKVHNDLRLYGATDHLFDLEIPDSLDVKLRKRIIEWRGRCFHNRLGCFDTTDVGDKLFKDGEDILARLDFWLFKTKKVRMRYR